MYIPRKVQTIIDTLKENNYEAFIVGGSVRDNLLNRKVNDYDITTNALPNVVEELFEKTIPTGIKHGTITVIIDNEHFEVTTYRIDGNYIGNRKPEEVLFVSDIKQDLSRRDFTINALAYNRDTGIVDYFNGLEDLKNKIIKAVGEPNLRFQEDALRMLRAIRFSAQLKFNIEYETLQAIKNNSNLICNISKERIRDELAKMLLCNNPKLALNNLLQCNLIHYIYNIDTLETIDFKEPWLFFDCIPKDLSVRLSHFLYYLFDGNLTLIENSLNKLRFDKNTIHSVITICTNKYAFKNIERKKDLKKLINLIGIDMTYKILEYNLIEHSTESMTIKKIINTINYFLMNNDPIFLKDLDITGKDLIKELDLKGKDIGVMLNILLEKVHENPKINNRLDLLKLAKNSLYLIK